MEPLTISNNTLPTAAASSSSSLPQSHLPEQGQCTIVLTEENFFEALDDMFQHAEHPRHRSWEAHLYRPWGYVLTSWCLTFSRRRMSVTCGAQWPFLHRLGGAEGKVMRYVYPDFVLLLLQDGLGAIFLIVEIKALPRVEWNTLKGKERAAALLTKAMSQTRSQARIAFLQHKDQSLIQAFLACGPWWLATQYSRHEFHSQRTRGAARPFNNNNTSQVLVTSESREQGVKRLRPPHKNKPNKKTRSSKKAKEAHDSNAADLHWLQQDELEPQNDSLSDDEDVSDPDHPAPGQNGKQGTSYPVFTAPRKGRPVIHHIMQLGASNKALNPWFKAFLASVVASFPDISIEDLPKTWFDQTDEECKRGYTWRETAGRPDDEGFAPGFQLPEGNAVPATGDDLYDGVDLLLQIDDSNNTHRIALNKDSDMDLSSLTSPHLSLPDPFESLPQEVVDRLTTLLKNRITMKQTEGFQPSDFQTPRSSVNRPSSTHVPSRPVQHTAHSADRADLPLPRSSVFDSDVPLPSSPSPHDWQRDHDGFVIPSLPSRHGVVSTQGFPLNLATDVPKSALTLAERSQSRQVAVYGTQPSRAVYEAFLQADKANRTPSKNQERNASAPRLSADSEFPAGRGRDPTAVAPSRPHKNRDLFTAASDIPSRERAPRARAHSVVGVTHAARADDFASDPYFTSTTPRNSGSRSGAGSATQPIRDELDFSSDASTSGVGPRNAQPPGARLEPRLVKYPRSTRGEFRLRSTDYVLEIPMNLKVGLPKRRQESAEQEQEASGSGTRDTPQRDEDGSNDGEAGNKGKGKGRADS